MGTGPNTATAVSHKGTKGWKVSQRSQVSAGAMRKGWQVIQGDMLPEAQDKAGRKQDQIPSSPSSQRTLLKSPTESIPLEFRP